VSKSKGKWIQSAISKPGSLRKLMKVKKGEKIPEEKLERATRSKNPKLKKRAILAETLRNFEE